MRNQGGGFPTFPNPSTFHPPQFLSLQPLSLSNPFFEPALFEPARTCNTVRTPVLPLLSHSSIVDLYVSSNPSAAVPPLLERRFRHPSVSLQLFSVSLEAGAPSSLLFFNHL